MVPQSCRYMHLSRRHRSQLLPPARFGPEAQLTGYWCSVEGYHQVAEAEAAEVMVPVTRWT